MWYYKITSKGIKGELVSVNLDYSGEAGIALLDDETFRLLDKVYISERAVEMWSDKRYVGNDLTLRFRTGVTDYYNRTKRALKGYESMYLEQLANTSFTMDVPFEHSSKSYLADGVSQYFRELEKTLDTWYQKIKKEIELGEENDEG